MKHKFITLLAACLAWLFIGANPLAAQAGPSRCISQISKRLEVVGTVDFDFNEARKIIREFDFGKASEFVNDPSKKAAFQRVFTSMSEFLDLAPNDISGKAMKGYTKLSGCIISHADMAATESYIGILKDDFIKNSNFNGGNFDIIMKQLANDAKFTFDATQKKFTSTSSGLIYESMNFGEGHRISHILRGHIDNDWAVGQGKSLFLETDQVFDLIDEGWLNANKYRPDPVNNPQRWEVDLSPKVIGTDGETKLRVIVDQQTKIITTAFPFK